jgi:DmsE family decaheme c-type cytochrome
MSGVSFDARAVARWAELAAALLFLLPTIAAAAEGDSPCAGCHEEIAATFAATRHGKAFQFGRETGHGCESCHGAATKHAESGELPADVINPARAPAEAVNDLCESCHGNRPSAAYWAGSDHHENGLSCADCHAVHATSPPRRGTGVRTEVDLCLSCHKSQQKHLSQRSHHPIREGKVTCSSCHQAHGSGTPGNLRADSANDLCFSCHQEKRGPFLWEHKPVRENCLTCHKSHGSNHESLLVTRAAQLCQSCHLQGRHQTVAGTETGMWYVSRQCLNCHSMIHGSNHPSGPLFQR